MTLVMKREDLAGQTGSAAEVDARIQERLKTVLGEYPSLKGVFDKWRTTDYGSKLFSPTDRAALAEKGLWQGDGPIDGVREALDSVGYHCR